MMKYTKKVNIIYLFNSSVGKDLKCNEEETLLHFFFPVPMRESFIERQAYMGLTRLIRCGRATQRAKDVERR